MQNPLVQNLAPEAQDDHPLRMLAPMLSPTRKNSNKSSFSSSFGGGYVFPKKPEVNANDIIPEERHTGISSEVLTHTNLQN